MIQIIVGILLSILFLSFVVYQNINHKDASKPIKEVKIKTYEFSTSEANCIGEWYRYRIEAESKEEAFKKLIEFFYGENINRPVKQSSGEVFYPGLSKFTYDGMPFWFAKLISGDCGPDGSYYKELINYANKYDIKLKL